MVLADVAKPHDSPVFIRGEAGNKAHRAAAIPEVLWDLSTGLYQRQRPPSIWRTPS
jgi:hypothetical protein